MAGLILMAMIAVMVVVLFVQLVRQKPVKKLLLSYVVILGSYHLFVTFSCGPNSKDLKIMTPQANVIAKYIIENGVPESLNNIQSLPYILKDCKLEEQYKKGSYKLAKNKDDADYLTIQEICMFETENRKFEVDFWFVKHFKTINSTHGTLRIRNIDTRTGILTSFELNDDGIITVDFKKYPVVFSVKSTGICNPLRM